MLFKRSLSIVEKDLPEGHVVADRNVQITIPV